MYGDLLGVARDIGYFRRESTHPWGDEAYSVGHCNVVDHTDGRNVGASAAVGQGPVVTCRSEGRLNGTFSFPLNVEERRE